MIPARAAPRVGGGSGDFHGFQHGFAAMDFAGVVGMQVVEAGGGGCDLLVIANVSPSGEVNSTPTPW